MTASQVRVHLIQPELLGEVYFQKDLTAFAVNAFVEGKYTSGNGFYAFGTGEQAAEDVFDLANNPSRQNEREQVYGRGRSVSVGDIVEVNEDLYLCAPTGWRVIDIETI